MKKFKALVLITFCVLLGSFAFACKPKPEKHILVDTVTLSEENVTLRPTESKTLTVTVSPNNAENKSVKWILTDNTNVTLTVDSEDSYKATITAKENIIGETTTYLQVKTEDETVSSKPCKITILTDKIKLPAPQNVSYDNLTQEITWDKIESSSGYEVKVDIEGESEPQITKCATNSLKIDAYYGKVISCEVKCLGNEIIYLDSDYSETSFKFLQLEEPKNLKNENSIIKFDKVENAKKYIILVYKNQIKASADYTKTILDSSYNPEVGVKIEELEDEGNTYYIKVQSVPKDYAGVSSYASKCDNSIKITKFTTPSIKDADFKFTYDTLTLSWKTIPNASGYTITRTGNGETKYYNFNYDENTLKIDVEGDKLTSGIYSYTLKILGNGTEYINSNESNKLQIEKLSAPTLRVEKGKIVWNGISNSNGYVFKIDNGNFAKLDKNTLEYTLGSNYSAKQYTFVIGSIGNGKDSISSELSVEFNATKLNTPSKAILNNNKILKITTNSYIDNMKVYLTYNQAQPIVFDKNDLTNNEEDNNKYTEIDMTESSYEGGSYSVYAVNYKEGYLTSEASEIFNFKKLDNTLTARIDNGEIIIDKLVQADSYVINLNGNIVTFSEGKFYNGENEFSILPDVEYNLSLKHYPKISDNDVVISNYSTNLTFFKLAKAQKLYVEDGEIKLLSSTTGTKKFVVKIDENNIKEYNDINSIKLEEDTIYTISMYYLGSENKLSSDYSNSIKVKLIKNISSLSLSGDTFSFNNLELVKGYKVHLVVRENGQESTMEDDLTTNSFSLTETVKTKLPDAYNILQNPLEFYVTYVADSLLDPENNSDIVIGVKREVYGNGENKSNSIKVRIMPSPTNLRATNIFDGLSNYDINCLYFDCLSNANLFELKYNSSYKILTLQDLSKVNSADNVNTYKINTDFLESGSYNFEIKAISQTKVEENVNGIIYNYSSLDSTTLNNISKIKSITNLSVERNAETGEEYISIEDSDTSYAYLLTINGKTIYEDVMGEGKSLSDIDISGSALEMASKYNELVSKFKSKKRILPNSITGTFNVNCYKIALPSLLDAASMTGGYAVRSNMLNTPVKVTRIEVPTISFVNGYAEWQPVKNADSYVLYKSEGTGEETTLTEIATLSKNSSGNNFDIYNYLNGASGEYSLVISAKTTQNNCLSSIISGEYKFTILETPTLQAMNGELKWTSVESSAGYYLEIYKNASLLDSFKVSQTTLKYDCMKTSKDKVIEGGEYTFKIKSLGEFEGDTHNVMTSLMSGEYSAIKLNTPKQTTVESGKIKLYSVNSTGVDYYMVSVNGNMVRVDVNNLLLELNSTYKAGVYNLNYFAVGKDNYLTSNISSESVAEKLSASNKVYIYKGEILYDKVSVENYKNNNSSMDYRVQIKREEVIKEFVQQNTFYNLSADNDENIKPNVIYNIEVTCLGDDYYYLNSDASILRNVVKLGNVTNLRIENGKLMWENPLHTGENSNVIPNGMQLILKDSGGKEKYITLTNKEENFVLDNTFAYGRYFVRMQNIGNESESGDKNFVNSEIINYKKTVGENTINFIYKLTNPTDLKIEDGINIVWKDPNKTLGSSTNKYVLTINFNGVEYSGVISSSIESIDFTKIRHYNNKDNENKLILLGDENIEYNNGEPYIDGNRIYNFVGDSSFIVNVKVYGDDAYITSDESNTIEITKPKPITNLQVTHGKITWDDPNIDEETGEKTTTGYVLSISRTDKLGNTDSLDNDYNKTHKMIYVTGKTYYNLTTVGRIYNISVRAFSVLDDSQKMVSESVEIEATFDSFIQGSGTDDDPYLINDENTLGYVQFNNFATYKLTNDITLTKPFISLFTRDYSFVGKFLGDNKTINNLNITTENNSSTYVGLLGYIDKQTLIDDRATEDLIEGIFVRHTNSIDYVGRVENLTLSNVRITVGLEVGAIAGYSTGEIENITVSGEIASASTKPVDIGGTVFEVYSGSIVAENLGTIKNCVTYAKVQSTSNAITYAGGITALNKGTIYNNKVYGDVYGVIAGGITSENGSATVSGTIEGCLVEGNINCYNYISNEKSQLGLAGGITAKNYENGIIKNCLVNIFGDKKISNISSANLPTGGIVYIGGLVGDNLGECYNNIVKATLYNISDSVNCNKGSLIGYNRNNSCKYNFTLTANLVNADNLCGGNQAQSIDSTNEEVSKLEDKTIINKLNSSDYKNEKIIFVIIGEGELAQIRLDVLG